MVDYFAVFGLSRSASEAEVRDAYRRLAKMYHPDSRPGDPESAVRMQAINEAKSVLLDPLRREEHRRMLRFRESNSLEQLDRLRNFDHQRFSNDPPQKMPRPPSKWDQMWSKWLTAIAVAMLLGAVGVILFQITRPVPATSDPVNELIARYDHSEKPPFRPPAEVPDSTTIPADSLTLLKAHADILYGFGWYRDAAKYYERCLKLDSSDEVVITNLSTCYFKEGRYARSFEVLSHGMKRDSALAATYYNFGELFMRQDKPFDARSAFQASLKVANEMQAEGKAPPSFIPKAQKELARLE